MGNGAEARDLDRMKMRGKIMRRSASFNVAHAVDDLGPGTGAQSIQRALSLLGFVGLIGSEHPNGAALNEIAAISGRPKTSVHRMLHALIAMGYVERCENGRYRLGVQSQILGQLAQKTVDPAVVESESSLLRLAELTQDTVFLTLRTGSYSICSRREDGFGQIFNNALAVGDRHPLGIGAGSLAVMTQFTEAEVDEFFDANARILTERYAKVSVPALREIIRRGRNDGFVHNPGLFAQGSWAIGVPVRVKGRPPRAALSIASIEERMTGARVFELAALLQHEARLIADAVSTRSAAEDEQNNLGEDLNNLEEQT